MVQVKAIDHINMKVRNLEKSIQFYRELFGFTVKEEGNWKGRPWKIIGKEGIAYLCIYEVGATPKQDEGVRISHFGLYVEDFESVLPKLKAKGVPVNYGGIVEQGHSQSIYVEDPDGFEIELGKKMGGGL